MALSMAAVLQAPRKLCSFSYVLFVIFFFYVLDVVSITVYNRHTLLNIGSSVAQHKPDLWGSPCIARTERKSSQGKAEAGVFVSISTTRGVMKGTYTLLNPSAPLIKISYTSVSTILATEGIYSDHNHGCLYSPSGQHRPGTQGTVREYEWAGNRVPRCSVCCYGGL